MNNFLGRNIHCGVGVCGSFSKSCLDFLQLPLPLAFFDSQRNPHNARRTPSSKNALLTVPYSQYLPHSTFLTGSSSQYLPHSTLLKKRPFSPSLPRNVSSEHPQNRTHHNTLHIRSNVLAQYRQPDGGSKSR